MFVDSAPNGKPSFALVCMMGLLGFKAKERSQDATMEPARRFSKDQLRDWLAAMGKTVENDDTCRFAAGCAGMP